MDRGRPGRTRIGKCRPEALLQWGFTAWPWLKLAWRCDSLNAASIAVARKGGLAQEAHFRGDEFSPGGDRRDSLMFGLTKADWQARHTQI